MNLTELDQTFFKVCNRYGFPSDVTEIFTLLRSNQDILTCIKSVTNHYQNFDNDLLFDLIHSTYSVNGKFFYPKFKYELDNVIFDKSQPRLCLGLHSKFSPLTAILLKKNLDFIVVSDFSKTIQKVAFSSGIRSGKIDIISRNETCLLNVKKFLQKNYLVSSTIDFKNRMPGPYNMLSDSILKLAKYIRPKTFFGINVVSDTGEMIYIVKYIDLDSSIEAIKEQISNFIVTYKNNAEFKFGRFNYIEQNNLLSSLRAHKTL